MAIHGRKPGTRDTGWGRAEAGWIRGSNLGSRAEAGWVKSVGIRAGKLGSTNAIGALAFYDIAAGNFADLLYQTSEKPVTVVMRDQTGGTDITWAVTDFPISPKQDIGGAWRAEVATTAFGQDNSGHYMHKKTGTSFPDPFGAATVEHEGKMSIWLDIQTNQAPYRPSVVQPANGEMTVDTTPTITIRFADPDEALGDYVASYRIEIWDFDGEVKLHDSQYVTTTSGQRDAGEASYTVTTELTPNTYQVRVVTRDHHGAVSLPAVTTLIVTSGGTFANPHVTTTAGTNINGDNVVTSTTPGLTTTWTHDDAENLMSFTVRIVNADTGAVVRGPYTEVLSEPGIPPGNLFSTFPVTFATTGWTALPTGATRYRWEIRGTDAPGALTAWAQSNVFIVNSPPGQPALHFPIDGWSLTAFPELSAALTDANDGPNALQNVTFQVRHVSTGDLLSIPGRRKPESGPNVWAESNVVEHRLVKSLWVIAHGHGQYEWRVTGNDPWGAAFTPADTWHPFSYVPAPAITNISPADEAVITTGTPTISATVDRTITHQRVTIRGQNSNQVYLDTGLTPATGVTVTYQVPPATLPNKTTYDLTIRVNTADGLTSTVTTQFRIEYVPPAVMPGVVAMTERSSDYDRAQPNLPEQRPNVRVTWPIVDEATVADEDWLHYLVYRVGPDGVWPIVIPDRTQGVLVDTTPAGNANYSYYVGYERKINGGIDTIQSVFARFDVSVVLRYTTITSERADDPAVTLHLWTDRRRRFNTNVEVIEILGQKHPDTFQGPLAYSDIDGDFVIFDDRSGNGYYTSDTIIDSLETLATPFPKRTDDVVVEIIRTIRGAPLPLHPRVLWYRDPKGRAIRFVLTRGPEEQDDPMPDRRRFHIAGVQVHGAPTLLSSVDIDSFVDVTNGYPGGGG